MLDCGKVTDTIYKRSVRKVIERKVSGAVSQGDAIRDISHFKSKSGNPIAAATAVLSGDNLASAGAVHLAVNRLATVGSRPSLVNIQIIVPEDLSEKSIKELVGAAAESCEKLQIASVQADVTAAAAGVRTMYACGEGGVYSAVWELAENAGLGARIQLKKVPLKQETVEICDYFNISPYQLLSVGAVLLTATHGQKVLAELAAAGIPAVIIGHLTDDNDRVVLNEEEVRFLEPFRYESLNQAKSES